MFKFETMKSKHCFIILIFMSISCGGKFKTSNKTTNVDSVKIISNNEVIIIDTIYSHNWLDFDYAYAEAFATVDPMDYSEAFFDKEIDFTKFKNKVSIKLNSEQIKEFEKHTAADTTYVYETDENENWVADCFYPRHNIVFYKANKKVLYYITVCFECNRIKTNKSGAITMKELKDYFNYIGLPVFDSPMEHEKYYDSLFVTKTKERR